jgi:glycerol-3-phosphate O-acyltransferase/dihydroxyacetone phosphate acyltransferase
MISNIIFQVEKVIDSETLIIKENKECMYSTSLRGQADYDFYYIPKVNNSILFEQVYQKLKEDACICIFPEGTSHDRTDILKLKAGIAHFALGAMSEYGSKNITIVPVGLNYFNRDEFRSEVIIEFGRPFVVPSELSDQFKVNKRSATEDLLLEIESRMKAVTLTAPSYMELRSLLLVRKLYLPPDTRLSPRSYSELCKKFSKGYEKLKSKEETKQLITNINKYINKLEMTGITDHEVRRMDFSYSWMTKKIVQSFIFFHLFLILALPGILMMLPFVIYLTKKAEKERIAAKNKNPNKIEALDVVSSVRIQYAIILMPIITIIWVFISIYYFNKYINGWLINLSNLSTFILSLVVFPLYIYCKYVKYIILFSCYHCNGLYRAL